MHICYRLCHEDFFFDEEPRSPRGHGDARRYLHFRKPCCMSNASPSAWIDEKFIDVYSNHLKIFPSICAYIVCNNKVGVACKKCASGPSKLNARVAIVSDHMNTSVGVTLHVTYQSWDAGVYKATINSDCSRSASYSYLLWKLELRWWGGWPLLDHYRIDWRNQKCQVTFVVAQLLRCVHVVHKR